MRAFYRDPINNIKPSMVVWNEVYELVSHDIELNYFERLDLGPNYLLDDVFKAHKESFYSFSNPSTPYNVIRRVRGIVRLKIVG